MNCLEINCKKLSVTRGLRFTEVIFLYINIYKYIYMACYWNMRYPTIPEILQQQGMSEQILPGLCKWYMHLSKKD